MTDQTHGKNSAASSVAPPSFHSGSEDGSFDCNICLDLAQDPVVTLCGHLFCWPCLYRWLMLRNTSNKDCPVCKASVEEEHVIPLYGRGMLGSADPRRKAVPGVEIPNRPAGRRADLARGPHNDSSSFNFMAGSGLPGAAARFGNFTVSAGFGLFPSLFGFQVHGYGGTGMASSFHFRAHGFHMPVAPHHHQYQQQEVLLSRVLLFLGCFMIFCLFFF